MHLHKNVDQNQCYTATQEITVFVRLQVTVNVSIKCGTHSLRSATVLLPIMYPFFFLKMGIQIILSKIPPKAYLCI